MLPPSFGRGRAVQPAGAAGLNGFFINGQSLPCGQALPVCSSTPSAIHKMFYRGMRPAYDYTSEQPYQWYASLSPALEIVSPNPTYTSILGETPAYGAGQMVTQLIAAENGSAAAAAYAMLLSCPGQGNSTIAQLSSGTVPFARLQQQMEWGRALANGCGLPFGMQAQGWMQGENDYTESTSRAAYTAALIQLATDFATWAKSFAAQSFSPLTIVGQVASHLYASKATPTIALAQVDAADTSPLVKMAAPQYICDYGGDWHMGGAGSKWFGAYLGLAYKRLVYDGDTSWSPLRPQTCTRDGAAITLTFNPVGQLAFDVDWIAAIANQGFQVFESDGTTPVAISTVAISGTNAVVITCGAAVPAGALVNYGWVGTNGQTGPGRITGARGALRDSQGDVIEFTISPGDTRLMHNWCLIFQKAVSN